MANYNIYNGVISTGIILDGNSMHISSGGVANSTTVNRCGYMYISSGGVASSTIVNYDGYMTISSGGVANSTTVNAGERYNEGAMAIENGGVANNTTINDYGYMYIYGGGVANSTTVNRWGEMHIYGGGSAYDIIANGGTICLYEGCEGNVIMTNSNSVICEDHTDIKNVNFVIAENCRISNDVFKKHNDDDYNSNKILTNLSVKGTFLLRYIYLGTSGANGGGYRFYQWRDSTVCNGGIAYIGEYTEAENITVEAGGNLYVAMSGFADNITIDGGAVHVATGGVISDVTISNKGKLFLYGGAILDGEININGTIVLDDLAVNKGKINLVLNEEANNTAMINNLAFLAGGDYSVSVDNAGTGEYLLAAQAYDFDNSITIQNSDGELGSLQLGETFEYNNMSYSLTNNNGNLALQVTSSGDTPDTPDTPDVPDVPVKLAPETVDWSAVGSGNTEYVVKYTTNKGTLAWDLQTTGNKIDTYGAPGGKFDIYTTTDKLVAGNKTVAETTNTQKIQEIVSNKDGNMDLFFGNAKGTWEDGYSAKHTGNADGWLGTGDKVYLSGKNKIADIFVGSEDANVLVLTDDSNGDALFVDDVFTALPDSLTEPQARFAQIDEIRAGAGDDIIDMTSSKFAYVGDGVKIYGGSGNDVIWANVGNNTLFGDSGNDWIVGGSGNDVIVGGSGNDTLHGGGGEDIFCFGGNWGSDTVEQLAGGEMILWFESGSESNWDKDTLTYADGKNTVKVTGVTAENITLKFGDDGSARYDELAESGCFAEAASEKIFEDKSKGYLA